MPTNQEIADNLNAYSDDEIGYFNQNTGDGDIHNEKIIGEYGASYFDGVDDDITDISALNSSDYAAVQALLDEDKRLSERPC